MATDIIVPTLGESVTEATVATWLKKVGDRVEVDEPLVELETDKVTLEVNATTAGVIAAISAEEGDDVEVGAVLGVIDASGAATAPAAAAPAPAAAPAESPAASAQDDALAPAVRKLIEENNLDPKAIAASGKDGRLTKGDVLAHLENKPAAPAPQASAPKAAPAPQMLATAPAFIPAADLPPRPVDEREEVVKMPRLRQRIAQRLKEAQNTAAMLTTFNEVDMTNVMALRSEYKDQFEKKHGTKLGFMSFFVKAAIQALKELPAVNAEIYGDQIIYKNYYDIGIAVGTPSGLVVPVLRNADQLSLAEIEASISDFGRRARDGKLSLAEMTGGTFTITNGGVFGSLMSTPIINPPQSGILGMHKIQKRPMVVGDEIKIRPMMYLAHSYDHRIIDGREAVTFLVRIKESLEDPQRLILDI